MNRKSRTMFYVIGIYRNSKLLEILKIDRYGVILCDIRNGRLVNIDNNDVKICEWRRNLQGKNLRCPSSIKN